MSKLIVGNWKMNGKLSLLDEFAMCEVLESAVIALPNIFLCYANVKGPYFTIAAQDCSHHHDFGAHTGDVSAKMLSEVGVRFVILGHSEKRASGDSVDNIYKKLIEVINNNMTAILCVDENYKELLDQKTSDLISNNTESVILAYEPLSAIGTGVVPTLDEISNSISDIKQIFKNTKVLYGGSVNSKNSKEILSINNVDGVLIGGASLKLDEMKSIISNS